MVKARKYVVTKKFEDTPKRDDFEIVELELPPLLQGEILVKSEWISVDPYQRLFNHNLETPYDQFGFQVGIVEESKDDNFPVGTRVVTHSGWCTHFIINPSLIGDNPSELYKLPDLKGLPISLGCGAVGVHGATAYFGFLEICKPKPGETVVVTSAAGAVGSMVGQIAKLKGCRVIGFAGSDDKVKWLESEFGFDKAFNYKTVDITAALKEAAPNGVDCYFDNVGGEISSLIISQMNSFGRISVCGSTTSDNVDMHHQPKVTMLQTWFISKQLSMEGMMVSRWSDRWSESFTEVTKWIKNGDIKVKEHITEGFDKIFDAFIGMLAGENYGKAIVKV